MHLRLLSTLDDYVEMIKKYLKQTLLLTTIFLLFISATPILTGKVIRIIDGDTTVLLTDQNKQVRIRLYGIDCPEQKQPYEIEG